MASYRSWMFVPGNNLRMLEKAAGLPADAMIFDLEDAVPDKEKEYARQLVKQRLTEGYSGHAAKFVRINEWPTPLGQEDVNVLVLQGLSGIVIPKTVDPSAVKELDRIVSQLEAQLGIDSGTVHFVPLIETALGLYRAFEIASSSTRILNLVFGSLDFILDIGAKPTESELELLFARSQLVIASRAAGIASPVDAVYPNIRDSKGLRRQSEIARDLGFQGKLCVHPDQIETIHSVFAPSAGEIQEALEILEAFEKALSEGKGAVEVNGRMIDQPVVERARKIVTSQSRL